MPNGNVALTDTGARYLVPHEDCGVVMWGDEFHERIKNGETGEECILCGRKAGKGSKTAGVVVSGGGGIIIHTDDVELEQDDPAFMGWYPVGSSCISAIPRGFRADNPRADA